LSRNRTACSIARPCEPSLRRAILSYTAILWVLTWALITPACRPSAPAKHFNEAARWEIAGHIRQWVEGAGGTRVWIKTRAPAGALPDQPDVPLVAVASTEIYPELLSGLEQQSKKDGLEFKVRETRGQRGYRTADIRLARHGELVCGWQLREVRQLLRAAVVIDDLGQDLPAAEKLLALPYPLTFSVLPRLPHSRETAEAARRAGHEVMLHLPMEPLPGEHVSPGVGEIRTSMSPEELGRVIAADLKTVPYAAGVNNHMGSRATADFALMAAVMEVLKEQRLYFVDSRTTAATVALDAARRTGLPAFYRSVFLDDTETVPYTLERLRTFRHVIEQQGAALAIGHPYPTTIAALTQFLPEFDRNDIQLVPPSELVRLPEVARLWPPGHGSL